MTVLSHDSVRQVITCMTICKSTLACQEGGDARLWIGEPPPFQELGVWQFVKRRAGNWLGEISEISASMSARANLLGFRKISSLSVFSEVCLLAGLANLGDVAPHIGP